MSSWQTALCKLFSETSFRSERVKPSPFNFFRKEKLVLHSHPPFPSPFFLFTGI